MTLSTAVQVYLAQVALQKRIPFDLKLPSTDANNEEDAK